MSKGITAKLARQLAEEWAATVGLGHYTKCRVTKPILRQEPVSYTFHLDGRERGLERVFQKDGYELFVLCTEREHAIKTLYYYAGKPRGQQLTLTPTFVESPDAAERWARAIAILVDGYHNYLYKLESQKAGEVNTERTVETSQSPAEPALIKELALTDERSPVRQSRKAAMWLSTERCRQE